MSLTRKDVSEILRLLEESTFDELTLETGDLKLHLRRGAAAPAQPATAPFAPPAPSAPKIPDHPVTSFTPTLPSQPGLTDVPSPLLGVFYRAPKPGEPPFVEIGQIVTPDTVIAIIEVMKLMNSVRAGVAGTIVEIPAQNAALVEYGETLIRVRPAG